MLALIVGHELRDRPIIRVYRVRLDEVKKCFNAVQQLLLDARIHLYGKDLCVFAPAGR